MSAPDDLTARIKQAALREGFARVGVAAAGPVAPQARAALNAWLAAGMHADMTYMERNLPLRLDPRELLPDCRSLVCLAVGCAPPPGRGDDEPPAGAPVARYARGRNYHKLLKKRCRRLIESIRRQAPNLSARAFVDAAPVAERAWGAAAGLGWIGRNGMLIVPGLGSYALLCEIACNLPLRPDEPLPPGCTDCRRCVEACPTGACRGDGLVDSRICLSYLTVEHRGPIDPDVRPKMGARLFGCDACQAACPHNRNIPAGDPDLTGPATPGGADLAEMLAWTPEDWDAATRGQATRRATHEMFLRNAAIAAGNSGDVSLAGPLRPLLDRPGAHEVAAWALDRLARPEEV